MSPKNYYPYRPSVAAAAIFAALFALTTLFHLYQMARTRTWFFTAFIVGGLFETIGFFCRTINATETPPFWTKIVYILQFILILLAPAFFAASIYMEFGRIILLVDGEVHSLVRKKWLTKLFVFGDVLSFVVQAIGASILAQQNPDTANLGKVTILAGLGIQVVFFGFFLFNIVYFWLRICKVPTARSRDSPWKTHSIALLAAGSLILCRCVYRIVEYIEGKTGELQSHEVYLYILDAGFMLIVMFIFHFYHPSEIGSLRLGGCVAKMFRVYTVEKQELEVSLILMDPRSAGR